MKKYIYILFLTMISLSSWGQEVFKDDKELHIGVGLGNAILPYKFNVQVPPIQLSYGWALADNFVLSGTVAYGSTYYEYEEFLYSTWPLIQGRDVKYRWTTNHYIFGLEARYYLADALKLVSSKFNPYGKIILGYNTVSVNREEIENHIEELDPQIAPYPISGTFTGIALGTNYSFNDKFAAFAELGYTISVLQFGVNVRL